MENNMYKVSVDRDKCLGCESCVVSCPKKVFEMTDERSAPVNAELCDGCEICVDVCPSGVITVFGLTAVKS